MRKTVTEEGYTRTTVVDSEFGWALELVETKKANFWFIDSLNLRFFGSPCVIKLGPETVESLVELYQGSESAVLPAWKPPHLVLTRESRDRLWKQVCDWGVAYEKDPDNTSNQISVRAGDVLAVLSKLKECEPFLGFTINHHFRCVHCKGTVPDTEVAGLMCKRCNADFEQPAYVPDKCYICGKTFGASEATVIGPKQYVCASCKPITDKKRNPGSYEANIDAYNGGMCDLCRDEIEVQAGSDPFSLLSTNGEQARHKKCLANVGLCQECWGPLPEDNPQNRRVCQGCFIKTTKNSFTG